MRKQRPPPKQRKVYRFLAKQGIICHGAAAVRKAAAKKLGFTASKEKLIGKDDGIAYSDYYVLQKQ